MRKIFRSKKIKKRSFVKIIILLIISFISFIGSFRLLFDSFLRDNISNEIIIDTMMEKLIVGEYKLMDDVFRIDFSNPKNLIGFSFSDIISFDVDEEVEDTGSYVEDPNPGIVSEPLVYIYSTHQSETYSSIELLDYNIEPNIMMASYLLREKLNDIGVPTIVETTDLTKILKDNEWAYSKSYDVSDDYVINAINKYPSIKLIIDLHRDSANKSVTTIEIDGVNYARVLFVVGKEHDNYQINLDLAYEFSNMFNEFYDSFSRGIYLKEGPGVNGVYNQDLSGFSVLLELGGQYNTIDEVSNTVNVIANIVKEMVYEEEGE